MIRILKKYDFALDMAGNQTSFSGYPGSISSGDDWNVMQPSQLMTLETTIVNYNDSLWDLVQPEQSIFTTYRSVVANRMANSGSEWADIFSLHNSGTYNDEWLIADYRGSHFWTKSLEWRVFFNIHTCFNQTLT